MTGMLIALFTCLCAAAATVGGAQLILRTWTVMPPIRLSPRLATVLGLGTGAFTTAVCADVLPDALEAPAGAWWLLAGAAVLWTMTLAVDAGFARAAQSTRGVLRLTAPAAWILIVGLSLHTVLEGGAVSLMLSEGGVRGLGFALAVVLHKLPEGILWGLAITAAFPDSRRLTRLIWIPALCTLLGMGIGMSVTDLGDTVWAQRALAFAGGAMLYIAFAELIPGARDAAQSAPRATLAAMLVGAGVMAALIAVATLLGGSD